MIAANCGRDSPEETTRSFRRWAPYGLAVILVVIAFLAKYYVMIPLIRHQESPFLLFFTPVMVTAWLGGTAPGLFATLLSAIAATFFLEPIHTFFYVEGAGRVIRLFVFIGESTMITLLAGALHAARRRAEMRQEALRRIALKEERLRAQLGAQAEELERVVAERTSRLEEANAALTAFARTVAHDLRAPLRGMQGFALALLEDHSERLDPEGHDYARRIASSAERMDALIRDLLAHSRLSRVEIPLGKVSLDRVVDEALAHVECSPEARASITIERPLGEVVGHPSTLVLVAQNLITNALKFVAPGQEPEVRVRVEARPGRRRLWVEDHGIGIAPEHHRRIFQAFERLHGDDQYPGTGVGLATVAKAVERMGGAVGVESAAGEGSRFWIELADASEDA